MSDLEEPGRRHLHPQQPAIEDGVASEGSAQQGSSTGDDAPEVDAMTDEVEATERTEPAAAPSSRSRRASQTATAGRGRKKQAKQRSAGRTALRESVIVLGTALVLSLLIKTFIAQAFFIPSQSMEPTLTRGDRVLVSRLAPGPLDLNRGDIVVFVDPGGWINAAPTQPNALRDAFTTVGEFIGLLPQNTGEHLIKRTIGMPGDHVVCCNPQGLITVNDVPIIEPYVVDGAVPSEKEFDKIVPPDHIFVLGDNRPNSGDSRYNEGSPGGGMVPLENVVGVAKATIWPLDRWTILRNPGDTFRDVPDPAP